MSRAATHTLLDPEVIDYLRASGRELAVAGGEPIVRRGDPGAAFYVILSGSVEVRLTGEDGRTLPLRSLAQGAFFGEMSVLTGDPVSADVIATGPAILLAYPGTLLPKAMAECAPLRDLITRSLASNLRSSSTDVWHFFQRAETLNVLLDAGAKPGPLVADSKPMRKVAEEILRHAGTRLPVLITGGPGTGKYYVALQIHEAAGDQGGRLIAVDCRRLVGEEGAKILFGSSRPAEAETAPADPGSLQHYGAVHLANRGTLLLRHVEALDPAAQRGLFRHLERQATGGVYPEARILATTGENLATLAAAGHFDPGLAAALETQTLKLPTLWERRKDILPLAQVFLGEGRGDSQALRMQAAAEHVLISRRYAYRNAAELREAVSLAALFAQGGEIQAEHIFTGPKEESTPLEFDLAQLPLVGWLLRDQTLRAARGAVFAIFAAIIAVTLARPDSASGRF
ncbi:MAG: cyclic nucleotide-binding domain-containing protein, partial [Proteobacteria bacterium]|nr:cyclic nucleotide-binding domain-containing protein [Pseudomonadota bacterium]